jgi:hypothetical protein
LIWFTREDCEEHLKRMGRKLRKGPLYNILSTLQQRGVIEADGGMPTQYRLLQEKSQNHPIGVQRRGRFGPLVVKLDLLDYLRTLRFEDVSRVHDIRLWTPVRDVDFVVAGLNRLYSVLCSMRARFMNSVSVPNAGDWIVKQWHFGKDAKNTIAGLSFEVTWHDFHGNLVRVYASEKVDGRVRVERVESPNEFVAKLLGRVEDAKKKLTEGITCVVSMNPKIESVDSALGTSAGVFHLAQMLHM